MDARLQRSTEDATLRALLECMPDGVLVQRGGTILFANERVPPLLGLTESAQLLGRNVRDFVEAAEWPQLDADQAAVLAGTPVVRRRRARRGDGTPIVVETHGRRVDFGGAPATIVALRDVTELEANRAALLASEERYRAALAAMSEGVTLRDLDGRLIATNAAAQSILGLGVEHLAEREPPPAGWGIFEQDGRTPLSLRARTDALRDGRSVRGLLSVVERPDGTRRELSFNIEPIRREDGGVSGMISTFSDVTEQRRAQARALDDARLRGLISRINEAELVFRSDGRLIEANDRACALYGYEHDELVALGIRDLRAPATHSNIAPLLDRARTEGLRFETEHRRRDGSVFPVEVSSRPFTVAGETYVHSLIRDLTEERRAERERRVLASLVEHMSESVIVTDAAMRVTEYAGGAEAMYGWTRAEVIGKQLPADFLPEYPDGDADRVSRAVAAGEPSRALLRVPRKDGSRLDLGVTARPLRDGEGRLEGWLLVGRDVGPEVAARRALQASDARHRASEANLRAILSQIPDAVLVHRGGTFIFTNAATATLLGADGPDALIGRNLREFVSDEAWPALAADLASIEAGEVLARRRVLRRIDDARVIVEAHATRAEFEGAAATVAVLRDVTQLDATREALRESEERFRSIVTAMQEGVVVHDRDGKIVASNAAAERILGLTRAQLEGRDSIDPRWRAVRDDGGDFPGEEHPASVTLRTGEPLAQVLMGVHTPEGELRWISISSEPLRERPEAAPYAVVATFADVTALRRTAKELRDALNKVKTLRGIIPICMFCRRIRDDEGYWAALERYLGEHTDARVSHGLCPACAKEHYPEELGDDDE